MCGFVVWYNSRCNVYAKELLKASALQSHRGPDNNNSIFFDKKLKKNNLSNKKNLIGFSHYRLSIIDLSNLSNQPMVSKNERYTFVYNGEIYDFDSLKKKLCEKGYHFSSSGDTEVLMNFLIENYNDYKKINNLDGMWSFVLFDKKRKELLISRDRCGEKPLYYYKDNENLILSTDPKSIFSILKEKKRHINPDFIENFISTGDCRDINAFSLYKNVKLIKPGDVLKFSFKKKSLEKTYNLNSEFLKNNECLYDNEFKCINNLKLDLQQSVDDRLRSDVPVACLVSGGIDSSLISLLLHYSSNYNQNISLFSVKSDVTQKDYKFSKYLENKLKLKINYINLDLKKFYNLELYKTITKFYDAPIQFVGAFIGGNILAQNIAERGFKVYLDGLGGDEVFGGYNYYDTALLSSISKKQFIQSLYILKNYFNYRKIKAFSIFFKGYLSLLKNNFNNIPLANPLSSFLKDKVALKKKKNSYNNFIEKIINSVGNNNISINILQKFDIAFGSIPYFSRINDMNSMTHSIECRSPFLSKNILKYHSISPYNKYRNKYSKYILRKLLNKDLNIISNRKDKTGLNINSHIFFKKNRKIIFEMLAASSFIKDFFCFDKIKKMEESQQSNFYSRIFPFILFENTFDIYY